MFLFWDQHLKSINKLYNYLYIASLLIIRLSNKLKTSFIKWEFYPLQGYRKLRIINFKSVKAVFQASLQHLTESFFIKEKHTYRWGYKSNSKCITFISSGFGLPNPSSTSILNSVSCVWTMLTMGLSIIPKAVTVSELIPSL